MSGCYYGDDDDGGGCYHDRSIGCGDLAMEALMSGDDDRACSDCAMTDAAVVTENVIDAKMFVTLFSMVVPHSHGRPDPNNR